MTSIEGEEPIERVRQFDELLTKEMARSNMGEERYTHVGGVLIYKFMKHGKEKGGKELNIVEIINETN